MLNIKNLNINITIQDKSYPVLNDVSLSVDEGETLGLVGESGCGKSITAKAVMGFLRSNIQIESGIIDFNGMDLSKFTEKDFQNIRGKKISMIFQDSMSSLNPLMKIGKQIKEAYKIHYGLAGGELHNKAVESLVNVGFENPEETMNKYPHQLSGGQRQRVMIAIAISAKPELLIADEPTTALDVTSQNRILTLLKKIQSRNRMSIIIISHDIAVISHTCSYVAVMYSGHIVEYGKTRDVINNPLHPYTQALISSIPNAAEKDRPLKMINGQVPPLTEWVIGGCVFSDRCNSFSEDCRKQVYCAELADGRFIRCNLYK